MSCCYDSSGVEYRTATEVTTRLKGHNERHFSGHGFSATDNERRVLWCRVCATTHPKSYTYDENGVHCLGFGSQLKTKLIVEMNSNTPYIQKVNPINGYLTYRSLSFFYRDYL